MRDPWKGIEPFRIGAKHTITRNGQPLLQTVATIDFGTVGNFRFEDRTPEGSLLVRDSKQITELFAGQRVEPVVDLYGFRWLFMPTHPPSPDRMQELRNRGFLLADNSVQMLVDKLLVRGLRAGERRISTCPSRKSPCYIIGSELAPQTGEASRSELWVDASTFHAMRWVEVRGTVVIDTVVEGTGSAKFGGFPEKIRITAPGVEHIIETQEYTRNPKFGPDHFTVPNTMTKTPEPEAEQPAAP